jgi:hypothetical protein
MNMGRKRIPTPEKVSTAVPRELDRRFKLTEEHIALIKSLYADGATKCELASRFKVNWNTIHYYLDPEANRKMREKNAKRRHDLTDPVARDRINAAKKRRNDLVREAVRASRRISTRKYQAKICAMTK